MNQELSQELLAEFRRILDQTLKIGNAWHERVTRGDIPTGAEAEAFRTEMDSLQIRAKTTWDLYCKETSGYKLPR